MKAKRLLGVPEAYTKGRASRSRFTRESPMTVKEVAEAFGLSTEQIFQNGYDRYGLLYSIGGPKETHARYLQAGVIPIYVARYVRDMERVLLNHHRSQP